MKLFDAVFDAILAKARELYAGKTIKFFDRNTYAWCTVKCLDVEIAEYYDRGSWMNIIDDQGNRHMCYGISGDDYDVMQAEIEITNDEA